MNVTMCKEKPQRCFTRFLRLRAPRILALLLGVSLAPFDRGTAQVCDDRLRCTVDDTCRDGDCVGTRVECPDDGDACTREYCSPSTGACERQPVVCPGPCFTGECDPATGCIRRPDSTPCDDESVCTTDDTCLLGICRGNPVEDDTPCTDSFGPCTLNDGCHHGNCIGVFRQCPDSDGDLCTAEFCDFLSGSCIILPPLECDRPCETGTCDPETGTCPTLEDGSSCDDGESCSENDRCSAGECVGVPTDLDTTPTPAWTESPSPTVSPSRTPTTRIPTSTRATATATPRRPTSTVRPASPTQTATNSPSATVTPAPSSDGCAVDSAPRSGFWQAAGFLVLPVTLLLGRRRRSGL
jgi:hypothetical protein